MKPVPKPLHAAEELLSLLDPASEDDLCLAHLRVLSGQKLKIGKGVCQRFNFHPAYLTYMQSTSRNMSGWVSKSWDQDCWKNINSLRYADDTTLAESEELKSLLMKVKEESDKVDLKFNIQKTKIMASISITS